MDPAFGTGAVKVTPAHDPNDFEMGQRHKLVPINVMNPDGTMNEGAGPYAGLDRFECRKRIVTDLTAAGLIEKIDAHAHAVGHCYRCDTVVEPRLSLQWFVKMKPLAEPALQAVVDGRVKFVPERWNKVYAEWMGNIRDWCISRQIWWGHRIPVFYCDACDHQWAARGKPDQCPKCAATTIRQDEDVLDTWFSSWLWPFSTFGWPNKNADLALYYPGNTLVTASEIIFFWVARMVMAGIEFMGEVPFHEVYIHGTVRDDKGRKMSKSLGNSIDPLTIIEEYSADALRYSLMMITATGQDVFLSNDKFEIGRNFGTKIWNAARFMQMQDPTGYVRGGAGINAALLSADDRHILAKLSQTIESCTENLRRYRFNDAAQDLYAFIWHEYCDWYVEYSKDVLYGQDAARRAETLDGGQGLLTLLEGEPRESLAQIGPGGGLDTDAEGLADVAHDVHQPPVLPLAGSQHGGAIHQISGGIPPGHLDGMGAHADLTGHLIHVAIDDGLAADPQLDGIFLVDGTDG